MPKTAAMMPRMRGARFSRTQPKRTSRSRLPASAANGHHIGCMSHRQSNARSCPHAEAGSRSVERTIAKESGRMAWITPTLRGQRRARDARRLLVVPLRRGEGFVDLLEGILVG